MSGLFRLARATADLVLISTVLAGVRRASGYSTHVATEQIPNESVKYVADRYLESGEWMMDRTVEAMARYPEYFKRK